MWQFFGSCGHKLWWHINIFTGVMWCKICPQLCSHAKHTGCCRHLLGHRVVKAEKSCNEGMRLCSWISFAQKDISSSLLPVSSLVWYFSDHKVHFNNPVLSLTNWEWYHYNQILPPHALCWRNQNQLINNGCSLEVLSSKREPKQSKT